jgi:CDP-diacylglycerol--glycerol-3-phosphate 3-phosphatidyltransferase
VTTPTYGPTALLTPANALTAIRILVAPVFIYMILFHRVSWWTSLVGFFAAASDYFDGIVARRHGTTRSGAFLDPLADKVIVLGALYALVLARPHGLHAFIVPTIIITLREAWMSWFRARMARAGVSVPASQLAKWKTFVQDLAIAFSVLPVVARFGWLGVATIWLAVAMTLYTGGQYYAAGRRVSPGAR